MPVPPPFCPVCGQPTRRTVLPNGYSAQSGERQFLWVVLCTGLHITAYSSKRLHTGDVVPPGSGWRRAGPHGHTYVPVGAASREDFVRAEKAGDFRREPGGCMGTGCNITAVLAAFAMLASFAAFLGVF